VRQEVLQLLAASSAAPGFCWCHATSRAVPWRDDRGWLLSQGALRPLPALPYDALKWGVGANARISWCRATAAEGGIRAGGMLPPPSPVA